MSAGNPWAAYTSNTSWIPAKFLSAFIDPEEACTSLRSNTGRHSSELSEFLHHPHQHSSQLPIFFAPDRRRPLKYHCCLILGVKYQQITSLRSIQQHPSPSKYFPWRRQRHWPLELLLRKILALLTWQVEETVQSGSMEKVVARLGKDQPQLVVVVSHERGLRLFLGQGDQSVNVLNSLESFLQYEPLFQRFDASLSLSH